MKHIFSILIMVSWLAASNAQNTFQGYFNFSWDEEKGRLLLDIDNLGEDFLYVNSLAAGVGSNDIGLDRGQLGKDRIVRFEKVGEKILLIEPNLRYRANSENEAEVRAMKEAFAQSVLAGFKIEKTSGNIHTIDLTAFLMEDAHGIARRLKESGQGTYKVDKNRSAIYLPNTLSFPDNTEFEAMITFAGQADGREIRTVSPDPDAVTVRLHHSFVRLPDEDYEPRTYHPYSGYFNLNYYDYATPIHQPTNKKFIVRHRLKKKDPTATVSDPVEPIIYYIDPGCPEPVKSALVEGASWWNQAFVAAGYRNAFQVKELPEGAHPLDVRYNMIQWVHRSTRGWSYGASVVDPRTGEIIKGHVSLGSLRVRQDFMIAQGILSPYGTDANNHDQMMEVALARLRQLSAHEVGHTLGLAHNFAASYNDRASVMDYPHPVFDYLRGAIQTDRVYDDKIGAWDKRTILYGYQDFPPGTDSQAALLDIIAESQRTGFLFISDPDARPTGGAHPYAHLWDNGKDPVAELKRMGEIRTHALQNFGANTIPEGMPYSELEKILVPVYLMHRYQIEAVSKLIGGVHYNYAVKGDALDPGIKQISIQTQKDALASLLHTISPDYLQIPESVTSLIPPSAYGYGRDRESFRSKTGLTFDPLGAAEAAIDATLSLLLHPQRLARINQQRVYKLPAYLEDIHQYLFQLELNNSPNDDLVFLAQKLFVHRLIQLSLHAEDLQVRAVANYSLDEIFQNYLDQSRTGSPTVQAHQRYLIEQRIFAKNRPELWKMPAAPDLPPGSPIGCEH